MRYLSAKLDVVFKMIFGNEHNSDILADFLLSVLDIPGGRIDRVTILNPHLEPETPEDKQSILDLKVQLDGARSVNVEILVREVPNMVQRIHFYKAKMVTEQLPSGGKYQDIIPTSCIAILDYPMYEDEYCHHEFVYYDKKRDVEFSRYEEIHILEIPKLSQDESNPALVNWLKFLNARDKEEFDMLAQTSEPMKKAVGVLANLSMDERNRMIAEDREKFLRDQASREDGAMRKGLEIGHREGIMNTARNMYKKNYPIPEISIITGLDETELTRLLH